MSSSARHSAMDLMFLNADSRAPVQSSHMAWLTRLRGDTSTAWRRTVPARPMRVESSRGPLLMMALTKTCRGFYREGKGKGKFYSKNLQFADFGLHIFQQLWCSFSALYKKKSKEERKKWWNESGMRDCKSKKVLNTERFLTSFKIRRWILPIETEVPLVTPASSLC